MSIYYRRREPRTTAHLWPKRRTNNAVHASAIAVISANNDIKHNNETLKKTAITITSTLANGHIWRSHLSRIVQTTFQL